MTLAHGFNTLTGAVAGSIIGGALSAPGFTPEDASDMTAGEWGQRKLTGILTGAAVGGVGGNLLSRITLNRTNRPIKSTPSNTGTYPRVKTVDESFPGLENALKSKDPKVMDDYHKTQPYYKSVKDIDNYMNDPNAPPLFSYMNKVVNFGRPATKRKLKQAQIRSVGNPSEINSLQIARRGETSPITTKTFPAPIDRTLSQADNQLGIDSLYKLSRNHEPNRELSMTVGRTAEGKKVGTGIVKGQQLTAPIPASPLQSTHQMDIAGGEPTGYGVMSALTSYDNTRPVSYSARMHTHPTTVNPPNILGLPSIPFNVHSAPPSPQDYYHATVSSLHPDLQTGKHKNYVVHRDEKGKPLVYEYGPSQQIRQSLASEGADNFVDAATGKKLLARIQSGDIDWANKPPELVQSQKKVH